MPNTAETAYDAVCDAIEDIEQLVSAAEFATTALESIPDNVYARRDDAAEYFSGIGPAQELENVLADLRILAEELEPA